MANTRPAAIAGTFYPADPVVLGTDIQNFLLKARTRYSAQGNQPMPKALIVPHAGLIYSGSVAASAYVKLDPIKDKIKRVILLGPCHRVPVSGLALSNADFFETPLGQVEIDQSLKDLIKDMPQVSISDETHKDEHSLEIHLPFLQEILEDFTLLPLVVGQATPAQISEVLEKVWGNEDTLILISTDLSHFLNYEECQKRDALTVQAIEQFNQSSITPHHACGSSPVKGLLETAYLRNMSITTLDVKNSGDTAGSKDRVVGYGAWMLSEAAEKLSDHELFSRKTKKLVQKFGGNLLHMAAAAIKFGAQTRQPIRLNTESFPADLLQNGASFVTIEKPGKRLRGCIGSLQAHQPLAQDIAQNAYKAAFSDPRFPPIEPQELTSLSLHISILSPSFAMSFKDEEDLLNQLRPHKDGLIIQDGNKRALFLPSVWEKIPDKKQFLQQLKLKAGLAADHWSSTFQASRFVTEGVHSEQLDAPEKLWQDNKTHK